MSLCFRACATQRKHGQRISLQRTLRQRTDIKYSIRVCLVSVASNFLMTYPKAKFNGNGHKVGPIFSHCQYEVYQTNLHIQTLL
jgi:hypothetical protein